MNAHQRRVASRRRHIQLPLRARINLAQLAGRSVYVYGEMSAYFTLDPEAMRDIASATVQRHIFARRPKRTGGVSGEPTLIDLQLTSTDGETANIRTSPRGLRLLNSADRAARPWWADLRRRQRSRK